MEQENDRKLEKDLRDQGYESTRSEPNTFTKKNDDGSSTDVYVDGRYYKEKGSGSWTKHS